MFKRIGGAVLRQLITYDSRLDEAYTLTVTLTANVCVCVYVITISAASV